MDEQGLYSQANGLQATAETMVKAGHGNDAVEASTRAAVEALVKAGKELKGNNPVVAALEVRSGITWGEVLTIATAIYRS
jgi:class 3 adenylate cyclase